MVQTRFAAGRAMFILWMFSSRALGDMNTWYSISNEIKVEPMCATHQAQWMFSNGEENNNLNGFDQNILATEGGQLKTGSTGDRTTQRLKFGFSQKAVEFSQ
jgi:hypothetical protein